MPTTERVQKITKRATREERKRRAWETYLDVLDAADSMRDRLRTVLDTFGLSMEEFRLLALLHLKGPLTVRQATGERKRSRQNMHRTIRRVEEFGWVNWEVNRIGAGETKEEGFPKDRRGGNNHAPWVGVVSLTAQGERLIGSVLPKQEKIAEALLRPLDGREQITLGQLCRRLHQDELVGRLTLASALIRAHEGEVAEEECPPPAESDEEESRWPSQAGATSALATDHAPADFA